MILLAPDSGGRNLWLQSIQACINETIIKGKNGHNEKARQNKDSFSAPPLTRNASYTWTRGELKGSKYDGGWLQGKVHGRGTMIYNDGSKHTGFWRNGLQHGRGLWIGKDESTKEGNWIKGKMEGIGKIVDKDGFIYEGNLQDGIPLGHGIKKEGKFMGSGASVYIGSWNKKGGKIHG